MALYTISLHVTIEAATPQAAEIQAHKATTMFNDGMTKSLLQMNGLHVRKMVVSKPVPATP